MTQWPCGDARGGGGRGRRRIGRERGRGGRGGAEHDGEVEGDGTTGGYGRQWKWWEQIFPGGHCRSRWEEPGPLIEESNG